jgi:hypothetical protein
MADQIVNTTATIQCTHAASVSITTSNTRVKVDGAYAALKPDLFSVSGCPFQVPIGTGTKPQPCVSIEWITAATRVKVGNDPVLLMTSTGKCKSGEQIPQGTPTVTQTQSRVKAI